jgi:hypothetical protein
MNIMKRSRWQLALVAAVAGLWNGSLGAQTNTLPSTYVMPLSAANTNQPGFIWNCIQTFASEPNTLIWAETQLAGGEGINVADPTQIYSAAPANATVPTLIGG